MIINGLVHAVIGLVTSIMSVFPTLPSIDPSIVSAGNWITTMLGQGASFAQFLYGATLFNALIAVLVAIWAFEPIYHGVMWVIKKIPFLNIK